MKRFILSTVSVLLATAAVAPTAQALPKLDADFNLQTLRLSEFDARRKSEDASQPYYSEPYYSQPSTQPAAQTVWTEQESVQSAEPTQSGSTQWKAPESQWSEQAEEISPALSLLELRHQLLDRT